MSNLSLPHLGKYITYEEVTGERVSMADAVHLLSQLNIHDVLRTVSMLNNCFVRPNYGKVGMRQLQNLLIDQMFSDELKQKLTASDFALNLDTVVFHRQQLLLMLRLALTSCPDKRGRPWDADAQHLFAEACLMVNDFSGSREGELPTDATWLDQAISMIPVIELPSDGDNCGLVGRSYELWLDIPNTPEMREEKDYVPIAERFFNCYGISLESFIHGLYFLLAWLERFDPAMENPLDALVINANLLATENKYPQKTFERVLSIVSCPLVTLRDKLTTEPVQSTRYDFTTLRRYPFIEVEPKVYVCFDRGFHRKLFTDGVYWLVYNLLSADEQKKFQSFFGKVFAFYVERLLGHGYKGCTRPSKLYASLEFGDKSGEVCDILVENNDAWIVMEAKGSLLTTRAKYSGDSDDLERDLRAKFVAFQSGKNKGIGQLANSIAKLLGGIDIKGSLLQVQKCRWIYPVLVSYDSAVSVPFIVKFFEEAFKVATANFPAKPTVLPPIILTIADLEAYAALGRYHELQYVLASYRHHGLPAENVATFIHRYYPNVAKVEITFFFQSYLKIHHAVVAYFGRDASEMITSASPIS